MEGTWVIRTIVVASGLILIGSTWGLWSLTAGSPDEIVDKIGRYAGVGTGRIYLQVLDLHDLDHLELIASNVMNQLR